MNLNIQIHIENELETKVGYDAHDILRGNKDYKDSNIVLNVDNHRKDVNIFIFKKDISNDSIDVILDLIRKNLTK